MTIEKLNYDAYKGKTYHAEICSNQYLSIEPRDGAFTMEWVPCEKELVMPLEDEMLSDWLENPVAYGAYIGRELIGFVEGFLEEWNNRFRITNICVFDEEIRQSGVGTRLLETIMNDAVASGARMAVLETQSFNYKAISFYKKHGFEIIGFDRYAYANNGPQEHNMLIYMGKKLR
ncbi:Acetyltransferase (GNAT) family protein [Lachnospiraceae bacterium XBB1006]|nr:Acetyltransferase (GNAT) family protein [Lachnospiraceae bacterium XBB1006]